ncbi:MAG: glycosyl transferase [Nitrospinota bacterium]
MGDFYQNGPIATLNRLRSGILDELEGELAAYAQENPVALVLPAHASEIGSKALANIVDQARGASYIDEIVVALGRAKKEHFLRAQEFFSPLPQRKRVLWLDSPPFGKLVKNLVKNDLDPGKEGKGRSAWLAYGYVIAQGRAKNIALHDCDITTYDRELLARLCYPLVHPAFPFEFCKGFYSRVTDRLHGRVTRLLVTPLLRSLEALLGHLPFLNYMDSFRYPLAGEFSMTVDLARINRVPSDWGLEVGTLAEVFRNCALKRVCQAELCENYDHKHQPLSADDPRQGLVKMSVDISKAIFRTLASEGVMFSKAFLNSLRVVYLRAAQDHIVRYDADAAFNHLIFDRHEEGLAVEAFARAIEIAGEEFYQDPLSDKPIPNWNRVISAIPGFLDKIREAVEESERRIAA